MRLLSSLLCGLLVMSGAAHANEQLQLDRTNPARTTVGQLNFLGAVVVSPGPSKIGGLSALSLVPCVGECPARELIAMSDKGQVMTGTLKWKAGRLSDVTFALPQSLRDENGLPVRGLARHDSESLVHRQDGSWLVGFEHDHRIEQFASLGEMPHPFAIPPGLSPLPKNLGLESLTELKDGRLFAVAENTEDDGSHLAWLWQDSHWLTLNYQSSPGLSPSDAAVLPGGDVVVLERGFNFLYGFRARLARVSLGDIKPGASLAGKTLAELESPILNENFEGLAIEPTDAGGARLYLVSDNNFNAAQKTILAAFELNANQ